MIGNTFSSKYVCQFRHGGDFSTQMMGVSDAYRIVTVLTSRIAVERVKRRNETDLAIEEYRLPGKSGIAVMKDIKDVTS